jgi:hypothetical protein
MTRRAVPRWALLLGPAVAVVAAVLHPVAAGPAGAAAGQEDPPRIVLDRAEAAPGDVLTVTFYGFEGRLVTVSVCGNLARGASADCDAVGSQVVSLARSDGEQRHFELAVPPAACPCVVRAAAPQSGESAIAPLVLVGHPVGSVVDPAGDAAPLALRISVSRASDGPLASLRSLLGGPTSYVVSVTVENRSAHELRGVTVAGYAGRAGDDGNEEVGSFSTPRLSLAPGQRWHGEVTARLPAPVLGSYRWHAGAFAFGAAEPVDATAASRHVPWLLVLLAVALVVDLVGIATRAVLRRRRQSSSETGSPVSMSGGSTASCSTNS